MKVWIVICEDEIYCHNNLTTHTIVAVKKNKESAEKLVVALQEPTRRMYPMYYVEEHEVDD